MIFLPLTIASLAFTLPTLSADEPDPAAPLVFQAVRAGGDPPVQSRWGVTQVVTGAFSTTEFFGVSSGYGWYSKDGVVQFFSGSQNKIGAARPDLFNSRRQFAGSSNDLKIWFWSAGELTEFNATTLPTIPKLASARQAVQWRAHALAEDGSLFLSGRVPERRRMLARSTLYTWKNGVFNLAGLSGPDYIHPVHKLTCAEAVGKRSDGAVIGYSRVHRSEGKPGAAQDTNRFWRGAAGWIWKDGAYTPLTPVDKNEYGDPVARPIAILPDDSIVVEIPSGIGLVASAQNSLISPIAGFPAGLSYDLKARSANGRSFVLAASNADDPDDTVRSLWLVSGLSASELKLPAEAASRLKDFFRDYSIAPLDNGSCIITHSKLQPAPLRWWLASEGSLKEFTHTPPAGENAKHSMRVLPQPRSPSLGRDLPLIINVSSSSQTDEPVLSPSRAYILNPADGVLTPITPAKVAHNNWALSALCQDPTGDVFVRFQDQSVKPPKPAVYVLQKGALRPIEIRCDLPLVAPFTAPDLVNLGVLGPDSTSHSAYIRGYGSRLRTDADLFVLFPAKP